jgi:hypothetical protein
VQGKQPKVAVQPLIYVAVHGLVRAARGLQAGQKEVLFSKGQIFNPFYNDTTNAAANSLTSIGPKSSTFIDHS